MRMKIDEARNALFKTGWAVLRNFDFKDGDVTTIAEFSKEFGEPSDRDCGQ